MSSDTTPLSKQPEDDSAEGRLARFRDHPEWDDRRRDEEFGNLVAAFPTEPLLAACRSRIEDLGGGDAEPILRIIETFGGEQDLSLLAKALARQPDLAPERAWEALSLLEGTGLIEASPLLAERWEDLNQAVEEEESSLAELAEQLEDGDEGLLLALEGLEAVEPEVRVEIIGGLIDLGQPGSGLIMLLRRLADSDDQTTRTAALDGLATLAGIGVTNTSEPMAIGSATHKIDPSDSGLATIEPPQLARSLVSAVDGEGKSRVALLAFDRGEWVAATFEIDLLRGLTRASGLVSAHPDPVDRFLDDLAGQSTQQILADRHDLAYALLSGGLWLSGKGVPPAVQTWWERTVGPDLLPRPLAGSLPDAVVLTHDEIAGRSEALLAACPSWVDLSDLSYELAEEILLREGDTAPDPRRDVGAFRFFFEHRLRDRLELYRRMLLGMAAFWHAAGDDGSAQTASELSNQLADPQNAVPGHPFLEALTARSLKAAQDRLRHGADKRRPEAPGRGIAAIS